MNIKKNIALIVGISIPVLMIVLVAAAIYLPRLFYHPAYNFLYTSGDYLPTQQFDVKDGKLVKNNIPPTPATTPPEEAKLYIYDVSSDMSTEVSFADAQNLNLDSRIESPDGFEIVSGGHHDGLFPFSFSSDSDYCSQYISGHNVSSKLDLKRTGDSYCGNFRFIGWIQ